MLVVDSKDVKKLLLVDVELIDGKDVFDFC